MFTKTFKLFLLFTICLLSSINLSAQQVFSVSELAGTYFTGTDFTSNLIELKTDGTYIIEHRSCTYSIEDSGKFFISNGLVHITMLKYTGRQFSNRKKKINLFDAKARKKFFDYDDKEAAEPLETEFNLVPVRWDERIYLVFESDLKEFSNAVNLGVEPRSELRPELWFGAFFLRVGDEEKSISGKPIVPAEWQSFLLTNPITAKIVSTEKQGENNLGIIDRGSSDGLKVGMALVSKDEEPSPFTREGVVVAVEEESAKILIFDLKIGDTVKSRYVPKEIYK